MNKIKTYTEATDFLFRQLPVFQREGATAYKPGLETSMTLDRAFGSPHRRFKSIHVAGTNGKGSTAHTLAAVLQSAGYKTGLYTSPHLVDFRERIRVDGSMIPEAYVIDFVNRFIDKHLDVSPSFFELTMTMAFEYFASCGVEVAVVEVGLGGRLDSTNIITPELCVITNISKDHTQFLGDTLPEIAAEKAGIIKHGIPVVIGEAEGDVRRVFENKAGEVGAPIRFAQDEALFENVSFQDGRMVYEGTPFGCIHGELTGDCQRLNAATIMCALLSLREMGWKVADDAVSEGFANVCRLTSLMGRWMTIRQHPLTICDTGHNEGGWHLLTRQLNNTKGCKHMVIGFVSDKDVDHILDLMSTIREARFYFTNAAIPRAMSASALARMAAARGLHGETCEDGVMEAYRIASARAGEGDMVFVGGSTFVVADLLSELKD